MLLRGLAMVVSKQAAESSLASDRSVTLTDFVVRLDDPVAQTLMISFAVVVRYEFFDSTS